MSIARLAIAAIAVILIGTTIYAFTTKSERIPDKLPGIQNPGDKGARTTIGTAKAEKIIGDLKISLSVPSSQVKLGEVMRFNISIENLGAQPHELTFNSGQKFDIRVEDISGSKVWQWSDGRMFTQLIETIVIEPGKSISFDAEWPLVNSAGDPVNPGEYNIFARITAEGLSDKEIKLSVTVKPAG